MKLVIAEKPSVANTIAEVLGVTNQLDGYIECEGYLVSWCVGHLVGLAMPEAYGSRYGDKPWSFNNLPIIPDDWKLVANSSTKSQFIKLKELMSRADITEIICATDAGREGECIFRYVYNLIGSSKPVKRLWTSSLEESAIRRGFKELKSDSEFDNLFAAGFARAKADWLVGMNATRIFSIRYSTPLSIGRVQTPTLAMIVERNHSVTNFIKEKYYTVDLDCGNGLIASSERIDDCKLAELIKEAVNGQPAKVTLVERKTKTVNPPKLYDLTTLQRDANRSYGFTAQQTLDCVQALYEKKLCSYPRTDSQYITNDMYDTAKKMIGIVYNVFSDYGTALNFTPDIQRCINNEKVSDHHALIPTAEIEYYDLLALPDAESKILGLIALRLICAVAPAHKYESTAIALRSASDVAKPYNFRATGKRIMEMGWKSIEMKNKSDKTDESKDKELPPVVEEQIIDSVTSDISEHYTSPPKQYTDDTLLSAMETAGNTDYDENTEVEKKGLGTPATRAAILENLVSRGYVIRDGKKIIPTDKGIKLINCVPEDVKSPKMTADWEMKLQNIEKGIGSDSEFLNDIVTFISSLMRKYAAKDEEKTFAKEWDVIGRCPKCGKRVLDYPKSYACESGKGGCGFVIWKNISGKSISSIQAKKLLENGRTDILRGFKSKNGKSFDAALKINSSHTVEFVFPKRR